MHCTAVSLVGEFVFRAVVRCSGPLGSHPHPRRRWFHRDLISPEPEHAAEPRSCIEQNNHHIGGCVGLKCNRIPVALKKVPLRLVLSCFHGRHHRVMVLPREIRYILTISGEHGKSNVVCKHGEVPVVSGSLWFMLCMSPRERKEESRIRGG